MIEPEAPIEGAGHVSELGRKALETLRRLLELSFIPAEVELTEAEDHILLEIFPKEEGDVGLLVGRDGETLQAYQVVVTRVVTRGGEARKPINIDVAGYGDQRHARLEQLADRLAETARRRGIEIRLLGMNPADRRNVHMALSRAKGVSTHSEDEGIARQLVISGAGAGERDS